VHNTPKNGVDLLTFHAAKGREWDCVVVAGAETGLLPHGSASTNDQRKEEIRLAYVAFTRAAQQLFITYADKRNNRNAGKSPLLDGMPLSANTEANQQLPRFAARPSNQPNLLDDLTTWRRHTGRATNQEPFQVCTDEVLAQLVASQPASVDDLAVIFGPLTAKRVAPALLAIIDKHRAA
jgi:DNA helicase-2/ATP-dependent DNA helicase PcrA